MVTWPRGHVTFFGIFVSSSKCPIYQPFIWGAKICRTFFGSLVIWLLNFGHVTTWSRDFFGIFYVAHCTIWIIIFKTCGRKTLDLVWFSCYKRCKFKKKSLHIYTIYIYIYISDKKPKGRCYRPPCWSNRGVTIYQLCIFCTKLCIFCTIMYIFCIFMQNMQNMHKYAKYA